MLESLFDKVSGLKTCNFTKKRLQRRCFFCEHCEIFTNSFFYRTPPVAASEFFRSHFLQSTSSGCLCLKQFVGAAQKNWLDIYNALKKIFLHLGSFFFQLFTIYCLILLQSKGGKKETILEKTEKNTKSCFMFCNNFFHKNTMGESSAPSLLQEKKRGSAKSDVSKVLYPDIGKIANPVTTLSVVHY